MPAGFVSRGIAMAALLTMVAALLLPMPTAWSGFVAIPLIVLFVTGLKPPRKWGGWVAAAMVPYFSIALGEVVADPTERFVPGLLAGGAMIVFFAALDYMRRTGVSLRS
jgi:uncharacterized membrane protein